MGKSGFQTGSRPALDLPWGGFSTFPAGSAPFGCALEGSGAVDVQPSRILLRLSWAFGPDRAALFTGNPPAELTCQPVICVLDAHGRILAPGALPGIKGRVIRKDGITLHDIAPDSEESDAFAIDLDLSSLSEKANSIIVMLQAPRTGFGPGFRLSSSLIDPLSGQEMVRSSQAVNPAFGKPGAAVLTILHGALVRQPASKPSGTGAWTFFHIGQSSLLSAARLIEGLKQPRPVGDQPVPLRKTKMREDISRAAALVPPALAQRFEAIEASLSRPVSRSDHVLLQDRKTGREVLLKTYRPEACPESAAFRALGARFPGSVTGLLAHGRHQGRYWELQERLGGGVPGLLAELGKRVRGESPGNIEANGAGAMLRVLTANVLRSLSSLHAGGHCHAALRPGAIQLRSAAPLMVSLNDFGCLSGDLPTGEKPLLVAFRQQDPRLRWYQAPEARQAPDKPDPRGDFWSLGMILAECLLGRHPLAVDVRDKPGRKGLGPVSVIPAQLRQIQDPAWRTLCEGLLRVDPSERWTEIDVLNHWHSLAQEVAGAYAVPPLFTAQGHIEPRKEPVARPPRRAGAARASGPEKPVETTPAPAEEPPQEVQPEAAPVVEKPAPERVHGYHDAHPIMGASRRKPVHPPEPPAESRQGGLSEAKPDPRAVEPVDDDILTLQPLPPEPPLKPRQPVDLSEDDEEEEEPLALEPLPEPPARPRKPGRSQPDSGFAAHPGHKERPSREANIGSCGLEGLILTSSKGNNAGFRLSATSRQFSYRLKGRFCRHGSGADQENWLTRDLLLRFMDFRDQVLGEHSRLVTLAPDQDMLDFDFLNISAPTGSLRRLEKISLLLRDRETGEESICALLDPEGNPFTGDR